MQDVVPAVPTSLRFAVANLYRVIPVSGAAPHQSVGGQWTHDYGGINILPPHKAWERAGTPQHEGQKAPAFPLPSSPDAAAGGSKSSTKHELASHRSSSNRS